MEFSLAEVQLAIYQESYFDFFVDAWKVIDTRPLEVGWYQKFLAEELQKVGQRVALRQPKLHDLMINCPPSLGKTRIGTEIFAAYLLALNPGIKIIVVSFSLDTANKMNGEIRKLMESTWYVKHFPKSALLKDSNRVSRFSTVSGGSCETVSPGSSTTSKHASIIICDDFASAGQASSPTMNEFGINYYETSLKSRVESITDVPFIWIGQRYHSADIYAHLLNKPDANYNHIVLPAVLSEDINPTIDAIRINYPEAYVGSTLDPVRLPADKIKLLEESTNPDVWAAQYMQEALDLRTILFKPEWVELISAADGIILGQGKTKHVVIDSAGSSRAGSDETAVGVFFYADGRLYLEACYTMNYELRKLIPYIIDILGKTPGIGLKSKILIENAGPTGAGLLVALGDAHYNAIPISHGGKSKEQRMNDEAVLNPVMAKRFAVVQHVKSSKFLGQFCGPLKLRHDDLRDVGVYAIKHLMESGKGAGRYSISFGPGDRIVTGEGKPIPPKEIKSTSWARMLQSQRYDQGKFD